MSVVYVAGPVRGHLDLQGGSFVAPRASRLKLNPNNFQSLCDVRIP